MSCYDAVPMPSQLQRTDNIVIPDHRLRIRQRDVDPKYATVTPESVGLELCDSNRGFVNIDPEEAEIAPEDRKATCYECGAIVKISDVS